MRSLSVWFVLVSLLVTPALAQSGTPGGSAQSLAVFVEGLPSAGGRIIVALPLDAVAVREIQNATHVTLRLGPRRFVFAVAKIASVGMPVGSTLVRLRDGSRTLFAAAGLLFEAVAGKRDLVLLTQGTLSAGVVTAMIPLDRGQGPARVATQGASQATIFQGGRETTVVLEPGRTGPTLVVDGSERESECRLCDGMGGMP